MIDDTMLKRMAAKPVIEEPDVVIEEEPPEQPTFCRVFTYPISGPGLSVIAIYAGIPFLWVLLLYPLPLVLRNAAFFAGLLVKGAVALSSFWYLTVCIRASAEGQCRAPNVFEYSQDDSFFAWLRQFFLIVISVSLCVAPAFILRRFVEINAVIFWSMLGVGIFLLPMCLLAMVIFDTVNALNPVLIIASIFSTFFSYLVVVLSFFVPVLLFFGLLMLKGSSVNLLLLLLIRVAGLYLLMMDAYLLGRFFYNNEEKLRWDV
ncbi:MAG: hypothetical protein ISS71_07140 [Phycisphaerae bacterium]|nr:hypothetical protein [Phycisphaerae bacterium]